MSRINAGAAALKASGSPKTAHPPIGTTNSYMARMSHAPVLVLTAEDALAEAIAMAVRTATT